MNEFGLDKKYLDFILGVLKKYLDDGVFYIFGSRVDGSFREYSDVDIACEFTNGRVIDSVVMAKIASEFENSTLPYEVDFIDLNNISDNFKNSIKNNLVSIG